MDIWAVKESFCDYLKDLFVHAIFQFVDTNCICIVVLQTYKNILSDVQFITKMVLQFQLNFVPDIQKFRERYSITACPAYIIERLRPISKTLTFSVKTSPLMKVYEAGILYPANG